MINLQVGSVGPAANSSVREELYIIRRAQGPLSYLLLLLDNRLKLPITKGLWDVLASVDLKHRRLPYFCNILVVLTVLTYIIAWFKEGL